VTAGAEPDGRTAGPDRRQVLEALADDLRPRLHRYAARLIGSVIDGEDVVQDTYARAFAALDDLPAGTPLRPWLFRIAHNRAIDLMRRDQRWPMEPIDVAADLVDEGATDPEDAALRREAVGLAVFRFTALPVPQRAAVILKDVLEESLADIAALLELSVDAVKAHLARGRARLRALPLRPVAPSPAPSVEALQFAVLFNRQDWAALRALLAEDVRLNQARRPVRQGSVDVGMFFTFYEAYAPVRLEPAWLEGREVHLVFEAGDALPRYFMRISWAGGRITEMRDHRYACYVIEGANIPQLK
jgi:RNA polymerase sigma-70 factor, ECF subfamily